MRSLNKNKRNIYYARLIGSEPIYDEWNNESGERKPIYSEITELKCNISSAVGSETISAFGSFTNYSRTITVADNACPLSENSVVWFEVEPNEEKDNFNYLVVRKADSKNGILYALREVASK